MSVPASHVRHRPHLRLVRSSLQPVVPVQPDAAWRRIAEAILASTWDVTRFMREQRWGKVHEELSERRELLACNPRHFAGNGRCGLIQNIGP